MHQARSLESITSAAVYRHAIQARLHIRPFSLVIQLSSGQMLVYSAVFRGSVLNVGNHQVTSIEMVLQCLQQRFCKAVCHSSSADMSSQTRSLYG